METYHNPGEGRGPIWGTGLTERCASLLRTFHLDPGLRRGGGSVGQLSDGAYSGTEPGSAMPAANDFDESVPSA